MSPQSQYVTGLYRHLNPTKTDTATISGAHWVTFRKCKPSFIGAFSVSMNVPLTSLKLTLRGLDPDFKSTNTIRLITLSIKQAPAHLFAIRGMQKRTLEHLKHVIKICPKRGYIFQNKLRNI